MTKLDDDTIYSHLKNLKNWELKSNAIEKKFVFTDFNEAFGFITRVALLSEKLNHHAEWWGVYNKVMLRLNTHDAGGVTQKDIDMADQIELYLKQNTK